MYTVEHSMADSNVWRVAVKFTAWFKAKLGALDREKIAEKIKGAARMLLNPRLLLCLFLAWMITNGWSYLFFAIGMLWKINWMRAVGGAYMGFLWLPFTPEKLVTLGLTILLLRLLYPRDKATLGVLREKLARFRRRKSVG